MRQLSARYEQTLTQCLPAHSTVCVALSGGMDSAALLHIASHYRHKWKVCACHINHGISPLADKWEEFCRRLCKDADVPLTVYRYVPPATGNLEDWARQSRLQAFGKLDADAVVLAHHADDQAETVLLRLLRGSGAQGIAAMSNATDLGDTLILRPWVSIAREQIYTYAAKQRLRWVEDEDNCNLSRRRNFLRRRILPLLQQQFGAVNQKLIAAGGRFGEDAQLLHQLAQIDSAAALQEDGGLAMSYFRHAGAARMRNWLYCSLSDKRQKFSGHLINEVARQLLSCKGVMHYHFTDITLYYWRGALYWHSCAKPIRQDFSCTIPVQAGQIKIPELGGDLLLTQTTAGGLSAAKTGDTLTVRLRAGGEQIKPLARPARRLTNLLQEAGIPPWRRQTLPLLFADDKLAVVAGVAVAEKFSAAKGEQGLDCQFVWQE